MIKISVIIPVYRVSIKCLQACLDSLVAQTLKECEFIVVSDGAPNEEYFLCEEYAKKDARFRFFRRAHAGVSAARNFGLEQVNGEYIAFVDSDDWIDSNMLEECYIFAKKCSSDIITMDFYFTEKEKDILRQQKPKKENAESFTRQILSGTLFGGMWLRIIKKDFYKRNPVKCRIDLDYCEDVVFWAELCKNNPKISYLNKAFYHYVQDNEDSITHKKYTIETYQNQKKYIYVLKSFLPRSFNSELNKAALIIKIGAMTRKLLTITEYMTFERTSFHTLLFSKHSWLIKIYLSFHTVLFTLFKKSYKKVL